ncbi:hypothetical protein GGX14DRAFT_460475 [Mycena pura]|uniref:MIT domain-containing protein n=1 Tax=Mycena pura TaxID=153505 RepID=A0AAD6V7N1_9AGAR|nr:hypothetical protein GGX14DRAFT_460475 [Mycena pura]
MSWNAPIPSETLSQTLTRALGAAQVAVKLDAADQDTMAIVSAYQRCISLLDDVIRREPLEEEAERIRAIRSTYRDRVQVLLLCRSVPIARQSTETLTGTADSHLRIWKLPGCATTTRAGRWTVERLKGICGCTSGSVTL